MPPSVNQKGDSDPQKEPEGYFELTAERPWEWQTVSDRHPNPWRTSLDQALDDISLPIRYLSQWPKHWRAFALPGREKRVLRANREKNTLPPPPSEISATLPNSLTINDQPLKKYELVENSAGILDFVTDIGPAWDGRTVYIFAPLEIEEPLELTVFVNGDYWMRWWLNGQSLCPLLTGRSGSAIEQDAHCFNLSLNAGRHIIAAQINSGSGGWASASEAVYRIPGAVHESFALNTRRLFQEENPDRFLALTFYGDSHDDIKLNGEPLPLPLPGMHYREIAGISPKKLNPGDNQLSKNWNKKEIDPVINLLPLRVFQGASGFGRPLARGRLVGWLFPPATLQTGPVVNEISTGTATVTCRTQVPAGMVLQIENQRVKSPPGLIHHFHIEHLSPNTLYTYRLYTKMESTANDNISGSQETIFSYEGTLRTLPETPPFRIAVVGDVYPFDDTWQRISKAVLQERPHTVIFTGDMLLNGRENEQWDHCFFHPSAGLLATVPFYPVIGNHEENAPIFDHFFITPGGDGRNWSQQYGTALLIGIDGAGDWHPESPSYQWLAELLKQDRSKFRFLSSHYPPYSSGGHGRVDQSGLPLEPIIRQTREHLIPLLIQNNVNAMFCGHDHFYERSELPGGLSVIVAAGAGSRLYNKTDNPSQNPYSQVFVSLHHYCILEIQANRCRLTSFDLNKDILDQKEWH